MKDIVIFGTGDIAQIARYYFATDSKLNVVAYTVDAQYLTEGTVDGLPVVPFEKVAELYPPGRYDMFIATSYAKLNKLRELKYRQAKDLGYKLVSYISSRCSYLSQYETGDNCFIFEDNTIQPFVKIGNNVTLWSGNHIGHHSVIHDHNFISSHVVVSGHCEISPYCFIGVNATLGHKVHIATENLIGAGSIITKSTGPGDVFVPARSIKLEKKSSEFEL